MTALIIVIAVIVGIAFWIGLVKLVIGNVNYVRLVLRKRYRWDRTEMPDLNEFAKGPPPARPVRGGEGATGGQR